MAIIFLSQGGGMATDQGDVIFGTGADEFIEGRGGDDVLFGQGGADTLRPGAGADAVFGGSGRDRIDYYDGNGPVTVDLAQGTATDWTGAVDRLFGFEDVGGSLYADTIIGDSRGNEINGNYGADTITLGGGRDTYFLTSRSDAVDILTDFTSGEDTIRLHTTEVFIPDHHPPRPGALGEEYFTVGTRAESPTHYLIFTPEDDTLYLDADGSGDQYQPIALIRLGPDSSLAASDFALH